MLFVTSHVVINFVLLVSSRTQFAVELLLMTLYSEFVDRGFALASRIVIHHLTMAHGHVVGRTDDWTRHCEVCVNTSTRTTGSHFQTLAISAVHHCVCVSLDFDWHRRLFAIVSVALSNLLATIRVINVFFPVLSRCISQGKIVYQVVQDLLLPVMRYCRAMGHVSNMSRAAHRSSARPQCVLTTTGHVRS